MKKVSSPASFLSGTISVETAGGACYILVKGRSITGLQNGPAEASGRFASGPVDGVRFYYDWHEITFYNLEAPPEARLTLETVVSPEAPLNFVIYPPGVNLSLRLKYEGAAYSGIKIKTCGLPPGATAEMRMTHYTDSGEGNDGSGDRGRFLIS